MSTEKIKKIAYITGTRADFGLMTQILRAVKNSKVLELQMYATGNHLMSEFGYTFNDVKREFPNTQKIEATFKSDDRVGMANFTGEFLGKLILVLNKTKPDFILTLGDRVEMLCAATACLYLGIPTGQVHGGDKTFTVDEIARHAITKLSHVHFTATKESAERIKKMGEEEWRIHIVGAPALDIIINEKLPVRHELFGKLGINPSQKIILLTQHPVSEEIDQAARQMEETISAIKKFNIPVVATYPHADAGGRKIIKVLEKERKNPLFKIFPSIEYKYFLALQREALVWVGNSSGAMIESPSFNTPVVNIGARQLGRQRGENVIDVGHNKLEIIAAVEKSLNDENYRRKIRNMKNPWGDGKTGPRVAKILEDLKIDSKLLTKQITY